MIDFIRNVFTLVVAGAILCVGVMVAFVYFDAYQIHRQAVVQDKAIASDCDKRRAANGGTFTEDLDILRCG